MAALNWIPPRTHNPDSMICAEAINVARRPADYSLQDIHTARRTLWFWANVTPTESRARLLMWYRAKIQEACK